MNTIKILPEYECSPIWILSEEGFFEPVDVYDLKINLSNSIKEQIKIWEIKYQKTYNPENPIESGFKNEKDKENFEKEGLIISEELSNQLSDYEVIYYNKRK